MTRSPTGPEDYSLSRTLSHNMAGSLSPGMLRPRTLLTVPSSPADVPSTVTTATTSAVLPTRTVTRSVSAAAPPADTTPGDEAMEVL